MAINDLMWGDCLGCVHFENRFVSQAMDADLAAWWQRGISLLASHQGGALRAPPCSFTSRAMRNSHALQVAALVDKVGLPLYISWGCKTSICFAQVDLLADSADTVSFRLILSQDS